MVVVGCDGPDNGGVIPFPCIHEALARISSGEKVTTPVLNPTTLLRFWLWGCDPNEICEHSKCDFHQMHLVGMVCTRVFTESYQETWDSVNSVPVIIDESDIHRLQQHSSVFLPHFFTRCEPQKSPDLVNTSDSTTGIAQPPLVAVPQQVSLQQLRDLVYAVQTQWPLMQQAIDNCDIHSEKLLLMEAVERLITQLFIWFGAYLFSENIQEWQIDDKEFICNTPPKNSMVLTDMGIKFYLNIFFVLFRCMFIQRHAVSVPVGKSSITNLYPFSIESFHVEAGVDDFHMLGMYFDIPAGCLLEYKHSYSGYYNNVSQCVYRHFPSYKRRFPVSLKDITDENSSDLVILPALKQIYPEIGFAFEDFQFETEVQGMRVPVLLSHKTTGPKRVMNQQPTANQFEKKPIEVPTKSDSLMARIAACQSGSTNSKDTAVEGAANTDVIDWYWFLIGADIYLVCILDGIIYKGPCQDLLAFYLTKCKS
jgi:hypothetical protein